MYTIQETRGYTHTKLQRIIKKSKNQQAIQISESLIRHNHLVEVSEGVSPLCSIVIPVYNKVEYTKQCLKALYKVTPQSLFELIIVNNASTDGTQQFLKSLGDRIRVIHNQENLGFVQACNQGAKISRGKYLVFLNNDTIPQQGWLQHLTDLPEREETIGAVGAKLVYPNGKLQEAGGIVFQDGTGWNYGRGDDPGKLEYNVVREVDYCSGACLLVKKGVFDQLGGFDERYAPAYYEDADLCFSIRRAGYRVLYQPKAEIIHLEGATAGTDLTSGFKRFQEINRKKFVEKWKNYLSQQYPPGLHSVEKAKERRCSKRILMIDAFLPMYDRSSGAFRLFNLLKLLRQAGHQITFIARNGQGQERYQRELEAMGIRVFATDPDKMEKLGYRVIAPRIDLKQILNENFYDFVYISFFDVAEQYISDIRRLSPQTQIIIDSVDVHFLREERQAQLYKGQELAKQAYLTKYRELAVYQSADRVITVTEDDRQVLESHLTGIPIETIPNIHPVMEETIPFSKRNNLIFVGNFNHPPNTDAVLYFVKEIWPEVRKKLPKVRLLVVGNNPPRPIKALSSSYIEVTGYVPDIKPFLKTSRISVAPLRYGAGMKGKIGEALSFGLPVVTTSMGAEGMGLVHGKHALIADDPREFAEAVCTLYQDRNLWERLSKEGRVYIRSNFSPETIRAILDTVFKSYLRPRNLHPMVSIVIPTWNQLAYTQICLKELVRMTPGFYELIMVDNGSTDGTVEYLESHATCQMPHATLKIIKNKENLGFAKACNQGIRKATAPYILLLNNDTVVTQGWLQGLIECMERSPQIGVVGPCSNYVAGPQLIPEVSYSNLEEMHDYAHKFRDHNRGRWLEVPTVKGFCMLIKRKVIEKVGLLDEQFGLGNYEDDDFCLRAGKAGFKVVIAQDVFIHHFGSRTFAGNKVDYGVLLKENKRLFEQKWLSPPPQTSEEPTPSLEALVEKARRLLATNRWKEAKEILELLLEKDFEEPRINFCLGQIAMIEGRFNEAERYFLKVLHRDSKEPEVYNQLGLIYHQRGFMEKAKDYYDKALSLKNDYLEALFNKGILLQAIHRDEEAIDCLKKCLNLDTNNYNIYTTIGYVYVNKGEKRKGLAYWKRALELKPDQPQLKELYQSISRELSGHGKR